MAEKKPKKEKIPRQPMPAQDPEVRKRNFEEVPVGYTPELAIKEAERCLQCKNPLCVGGCPVSIDIPDFIRLIKETAPPLALIENLTSETSEVKGFDKFSIVASEERDGKFGDKIITKKQ